MAQPATNPKIEELRTRLKTDPKNRIFYPLAEELRKVGQFAESEQVLRAGLAYHPTYLSAWVSLGRVLREQKNDGAAVEALSKALQLDPGNVVAARLLGDAHLGLGEKIEAIKKYKLVQALMPGDEELDALVEQLDRELNPPTVAPAAPEESPFAQEPEASAFAAAPAGPELAADMPFAPGPEVGEETATLRPRREEAPFADDSPFAPESPTAAAPATSIAPVSISPFESEAAGPVESPFADDSAPPIAPPTPAPSFFAEEQASAEAEAEPEPMSVWPAEPPSFTDAAAVMQKEFQLDAARGDRGATAEQSESPFEESAGHTAPAFELETPIGMHEASGPLATSIPSEVPDAEFPPSEVPPAAFDSRLSAPVDESDVFAPAAEPAREPEAYAEGAQESEGDLTSTLTMADLYQKQGLLADARQIYERILQRDPGNEAVRSKLAALASLPAGPESEPAGAGDRVSKLERWLSKVGKREVGRV